MVWGPDHAYVVDHMLARSDNSIFVMPTIWELRK